MPENLISLKPDVDTVISLNRIKKTIRRSIENHLRFLIIISVGLILLIANVILDYTVVHWLGAEYDRALHAKAKALVTLTKQEGNEVELDFADEFMPEFESPTNSEYFQLWLQDGTLLERSHSLDDLDLPYSKQYALDHRFNDMDLPDGRKGRKIEIVFIPQIVDKSQRTAENLAKQQRAILVVARERESLNDLLFTVHLSLVIAVFLMILIIGFIVKYAVKKGLEPLHAVKKQLSHLNAEQLDERLIMDSQPAELNPLIEQFNQLFERLETSFKREQRFSADVAHELRTPVSELRNLSDVAIRWPCDRQLVIDFFSDVFDISTRMQHTINNLMALARCEKGKFELEYREAELTEFVNLAWLRVKKEAESKHLVFIPQFTGTFWFHTSMNEFDLILNNVFSNAVEYSPENGTITASITEADGVGQFELSNPAEHLVPSDLDDMFDRLWRKDLARSSEHHAGLGLSLVKAYAAALNLDVDVKLEQTNLFSFRLSGMQYVEGLSPKKIARQNRD